MGVEAKSSLVCLFVSLWYQGLFIDHCPKKILYPRGYTHCFHHGCCFSSTLHSNKTHTKQIILCGNTRYHHTWKVRMFLMWMVVSHHYQKPSLTRHPIWFQIQVTKNGKNRIKRSLVFYSLH